LKTKFPSLNSHSKGRLCGRFLAPFLLFLPSGLYAKEVLFSDDFEEIAGAVDTREGWKAQGLLTDAFLVEGGVLIAAPQSDHDSGIALPGVGAQELFEVHFDLRVEAAPHAEGDFVLVLSNSGERGPWVARLEVAKSPPGYRLALVDGSSAIRTIGQTDFAWGDTVRVMLRFNRAERTVTLRATSTNGPELAPISLIEPELANWLLDTPLFLRRKTFDGTGAHSIDNVEVLIPNE
jgi:hypothetical protein